MYLAGTFVQNEHTRLPTAELLQQFKATVQVSNCRRKNSRLARFQADSVRDSSVNYCK